MDGQTISFGPFRLLAAQRLLLEGGRSVRLGSRAFDILIALVERAGQVIGKDELIARAWPQTFVEESNLKLQVHALRRALGDGQGGHRYVVTVPGRGYNFVAPIALERAPQAQTPTIGPPGAGLHNLPYATARMIGREHAVAAIKSRLLRERLVTVIGPGGIGKTTVALAVAEQMIRAYEHGVWLVDLAPLNDPRLVASTVATVLGLEIHSEDPLLGLIAALKDRRILLLIDTCEHVIDAVVNLAAAALRGAPGISILATSREPLGAVGEQVHRLRPLTSPQSSAKPTAVEAAGFPAVQLFVERVNAVFENFALSDANAPLVAGICRRLDGLPLAIEFAAPRVEVLGIDGLAHGLVDGLPQLRAHRRGVLPRHRTMRSVVDWSYSLLANQEQTLFRSLGIFAGGFTIEAAAAVAMEPMTRDGEAVDRLADMVTKSLVVADVSGANPRFRLLDTTRAYTLEKLDEHSEREQFARPHADYYRKLFERAENEAAARPADEWLADYGAEIDNLRSALDWAFSSRGDGSVGAALTADAFPLWMRLTLLEECRSRATQALDHLGERETNIREQMRLYAALGASTREASEMGDAFTKTLHLAKHLGDVEYQLRALRGLHFHHLGSGQFRAAYPFAQEFYALTLMGSDRKDLIFAESMLGMSEHYVGHQTRARRHLEQVLAQDAVSDDARDLIRFQDVVRFGGDLRVSVRVFLARVLWLEGFADQAMRAVEQSFNEAATTGHAISQGLVLAMAACPIAFWVGDQSAAARYAAMLVELSQQHSLSYWTAIGAGFEQALVIKAGGFDRGSFRHRAVDTNFRFLTVLIELAKALGEVGRITEALEAVAAGIKQFEPGCFTPEVIRLKGELLLLQGLPEAAELAETCFHQALDRAREHGTLSWELRIATSLARLRRDQGRRSEAIEALRPVYDRFTEGFETADLVAAKELLQELRTGSA